MQVQLGEHYDAHLPRVWEALQLLAAAWRTASHAVRLC